MMISKCRTIYLLLFLGFSLWLHAQFDREQFLHSFRNAGSKNKVLMAAAIPYSELKEVYPLIKDTLAEIKRGLYRNQNAENREFKFLFDKIDADIALHEKNYGKAALILESAMQTHATTVNDTLRCLSMLKDAFVKMHNINRAFEIQYLMESRWQRKSDSVHIDFGVPKSALYGMLGLKTEAISERRREFNNRKNKTDTDLVVGFYNDMGVFFNKKKLSDS